MNPTEADNRIWGYVEGLNALNGGDHYEADYLEPDSFYVNFKIGDLAAITEEDVMKLNHHAHRILEILTEGDDDDDNEWRLYSDPNYWDKDGEDTNELSEAKTVQFMIYHDTKEIDKPKAKIWQVSINETLSRMHLVRAYDRDSAVGHIRKLYESGEIVLDADDYVDCSGEVFCQGEFDNQSAVADYDLAREV